MCMSTFKLSWNESEAEKYAHFHGSYVFKLLAIESLGSLNESALNLFLDLGRRISSATGDDREGLLLFQRLSVTLQRFNAILNETSCAGGCHNMPPPL